MPNSARTFALRNQPGPSRLISGIRGITWPRWRVAIFLRVFNDPAFLMMMIDMGNLSEMGMKKAAW
jgi:hypothetical protein